MCFCGFVLVDVQRKSKKCTRHSCRSLDFTSLSWRKKFSISIWATWNTPVETHWTRCVCVFNCKSDQCVCVCDCVHEEVKCSNVIVCVCVWQVSARSWDHNECFAQFSGDHTLLPGGYELVLHKLAQGLDIRLKTAVLWFIHCFLMFIGVLSLSQ